MYEITKRMDLKTGKVTYTRTIDLVTVSVVASCQAEAERKLSIALLEKTSLDEILNYTVQKTITKYRDMLALEKNEHDITKAQLADERNKPWYRRLGLWSH